VGRRAAVRGLPSGDGHGPTAWPSTSHLHGFHEVVALPDLPGGVGPDQGEGRAPLEISWVTLERWAREKTGPAGQARGRPYRDDAEQLTDTQLLDKLRGFGIELDRAGLEAACQDALSAQEVAARLMSRHVSAPEELRAESDWIWLAVLALWQRWWPAKPCLETVDDKIQDGYRRVAQEPGAATDTWLDAWSDVLHLCDAAGVSTVSGFDARFPLTQSLFNWNQDLEMELGNAGLQDPAKLRARIAVGEQFMRRFTDCDHLVAENWRRAIAEAWFWLGETATADQLYQDWLKADPRWGYGWIGWASGYMPPVKGAILAPADYGRAEDLLHQGYDVAGVRDRDAIAEWLRQAREESARPGRD